MTYKAVSSFERQRGLLQFVEQHQRVTVPQICEQFAISPATARRDLDTLAELGKIQRVHGGALALRNAPPEPPVLQRAAEQADQKQYIAQAAAALIVEGDTVFLSSGTTVLEVARQLRERRNLTVITNSLMVINMLADVPQINVIALGGVLRRSEMSLVGHLTEQGLTDVRANKVILGVRGVDLNHGLTNADLQETAIDRAVIRTGAEIIVVADNTKLGRASTALVVPLADVHILVTDRDAPPEFVEAVREKGLTVITA